MTYNKKTYFFIVPLFLFSYTIAKESLSKGEIASGSLRLDAATRKVIMAKMRNGTRGTGLNEQLKSSVVISEEEIIKKGTKLVFSLKDNDRPSLRVNKIKAGSLEVEHPIGGYATVDWPETKILNFKNYIVLGQGKDSIKLHLRINDRLSKNPEELNPS